MMDPKTEQQISRFLSLVLRHRPEELSLDIDPGGWVAVAPLVDGLNARFGIGQAELEHIVANDGKARYTLAAGRIRANQGHSIPVDLGLVPLSPPPVLWHGTVARFLPAIEAEGLRPQGRHHVHLSPDIATARQVGGRRGTPVILRIDAGGLAAAGHLFYQSANGVWLTAFVPPDALSRADTDTQPEQERP